MRQQEGGRQRGKERESREKVGDGGVKKWKKQTRKPE